MYRALCTVAILITLLVTACDRSEEVRTRPAAGATVETIVANPHEHFGRKVTVSASVGQVMDDGAFTLQPMGMIGDLLVIPSGDDVTAGSPVQATDLVEVSGTVQQLNRAEIAKELGRQMNGDLYSTREGRPVLVAEHIRTLPR